MQRTYHRWGIQFRGDNEEKRARISSMVGAVKSQLPVLRSEGSPAFVISLFKVIMNDHRSHLSVIVNMLDIFGRSRSRSRRKY